jgi:hypothetical protein
MSNLPSKFAASALSRLRGCVLPGASTWIQRPTVFCTMVLGLLAMAVWGHQAVEHGDFVMAFAWCITPVTLVCYLVFTRLSRCCDGLASYWSRRPCFAGVLFALVPPPSGFAQRAFALPRARDSIP